MSEYRSKIKYICGSAIAGIEHKYRDDRFEERRDCVVRLFIELGPEVYEKLGIKSHQDIDGTDPNVYGFLYDRYEYRILEFLINKYKSKLPIRDEDPVYRTIISDVGFYQAPPRLFHCDMKYQRANSYLHIIDRKPDEETCENSTHLELDLPAGKYFFGPINLMLTDRNPLKYSLMCGVNKLDFMPYSIVGESVVLDLSNKQYTIMGSSYISPNCRFDNKLAILKSGYVKNMDEHYKRQNTHSFTCRKGFKLVIDMPGRYVRLINNRTGFTEFDITMT